MEPSHPDEHWVYMYPNGVSGVSGRERLPGKWNDFRNLDSDIGLGLFGVAEVVPEPGTLLLLLSTAAVGLALYAWRRRKA